MNFFFTGKPVGHSESGSTKKGVKKKPFIFLTGFMGSGKTTLGKKVAEALSMEFIDLDAHIERNEGTSILKFFETKGEKEFRKAETRYLKQILNAKKSLVMALGGGTFCSESNLKLIKKSGIVIYLKLPATILAQRMEGSGRKRPLLKGLSGKKLLNEIRQKLKQRKKYYDQAHIALNGLNLSSLSLIRSLLAFRT